MRISVTGNSAGGSSGFTLVELLAVLVVVGLASAAVVLTMPDPRDTLRVEAERLAARAHVARDEAIVEARPVALIIDSGGYGFERFRKGAWRPISDPPLETRKWADGIAVNIQGASDGRIAFDEMGAGDAAAVTLSRGDDRITVRIETDGTIDAGA